MESLIKNIGILLILAGFIFLVVSVFKGMATNTLLLISAIAIIGGLFVHIIVNQLTEK